MSKIYLIQVDYDNEHKMFSPSASERWINCPGSVKKEFGLEDDPSEYALEGSAAHELAAYTLKTGEDPQNHLGKFISYCGNDFEITQEMVDAVKVLDDTVSYYVSKLQSPMVHVEQKFEINGDNDLGGTADVVIAEPFGKLIVIDFKYGRGKAVEAKGNSQMRCYSLGAFQKLAQAYDPIVNVIVQPRKFHPDGFVRSETLSRQKLLSWNQSVLEPAVMRAKSDEPIFQAGQWCDWCKYRPNCKEQQKKIFEVLEINETKNVNLPKPEEVSPEKMGELLEFTKFLESWIKSIKNYASGELKKGREIPGWCMAEGRSTRKVKDNPNTDGIKALGISLYKETEKGVTELENEMKALKIKPAERKTILDDLFIKKPGNPTLKPMGKGVKAISYKNELTPLVEKK